MPLCRCSVCCSRGTRCQALGACAGPPRPPAPRTRGTASVPESSARGAGGRGQEGASEGASEKVVGFARRREWRQGPLGGDAAEPPGHRAVAAAERAGSEATDSPVGCQRSWEAHILSSSRQMVPEMEQPGAGSQHPGPGASFTDPPTDPPPGPGLGTPWSPAPAPFRLGVL